MTTSSAPLADAPVRDRSVNWVTLLSRLGPLVGLVLVFALFGSLRPTTFLSQYNIKLMLLQSAVVGVAALGMTMIIISGGIDLSVGSNIALCTVVVAMLLNRDYSPFISAAGGIGASALCGVVIGLLVTKLKLSPFIVTLGMWGALRGLAKGLANESMVRTKLSWLNDLLIVRPQWYALPIGVWLTLLLSLVVILILRYTRFGRHIFAIGSNELTARLCGVRVEWTKLMIYAFAGALAGVAGVLQYSYLTVGDPTTAAGMELNIIAAVVIGGASLAGGEGSIVGSLIGALIMTAVANGCTKLGLANWVQEIVTGGIIVLAVALDRWRQKAGA